LLLAHATGIAAEILFCGWGRKKDWSGKPGFLPPGAKNAPKLTLLTLSRKIDR
jgi:hypothetical protein